MKLAHAAAPLAMLLLSGCVVGPDYETPQTALPIKFSEGSTRGAADVTLQPWWTAFNDRRLNTLVDQGLDQNLDVLQAIERITSAEANFESADSAAFPQLSVSADHQVSKTNASGALVTRDSDTTNTTTGTAGVSWLIDLFGQLGR